MAVHLKPEIESRLQQLSVETGRPADELLEDAMASYLHELTSAREMIDARYDELKSGRVEPVDGEHALDKLRGRSKPRRSNRP
jgi:predicted DNA-binding protein